MYLLPIWSRFWYWFGWEVTNMCINSFQEWTCVCSHYQSNTIWDLFITLWISHKTIAKLYRAMKITGGTFTQHTVVPGVFEIDLITFLTLQFDEWVLAVLFFTLYLISTAVYSGLPRTRKRADEIHSGPHIGTASYRSSCRWRDCNVRDGQNCSEYACKINGLRSITPLIPRAWWERQWTQNLGEES